VQASLSDMLPSLSEAWATAYVQILITLVVFALGIPALAVQLVVQDDVRDVFHRRMKVTAWKTSVAILLMAFMSFVWFLHPPFSTDGAETTSAAETAVTIPLRFVPLGPPADARPGGGAVLAAGEPRITNAQPAPRKAGSHLPALAASLMMTLVPIVIILLGIKQAKFLRRPFLIKELESELNVEKLTDNWRGRAGDLFFKKKRAARPLDEETLHDLIYLGRHGKAGANKQMVLDALNRLARAVQDTDTYEGAELEELIHGLRDVVINNEQVGNDADFNRVLEILNDIRQRLTHREYTSKYIDAWLTRTVLEELGVAAVRSKSGQTAERFIESASEYGYSEIIFKMGLAALENQQFHTATLALDKLEALAEEKGYANIDDIHELIGLLAHFALGGPATRMRADSFLAEHKGEFMPTLDDCLIDAYKHHYARTYFNTADAIYKLREAIRKGEWSPLLIESLEPQPPRRAAPVA
jgi:hypothetical protein